MAPILRLELALSEVEAAHVSKPAAPRMRLRTAAAIRTAAAAAIRTAAAAASAAAAAAAISAQARCECVAGSEVVGGEMRRRGAVHRRHRARACRCRGAEARRAGAHLLSTQGRGRARGCRLGLGL